MIFYPFHLVSITELIFLPKNWFSKHVVVLKNDYITPKSLLILPKQLMIDNTRVSYHWLSLKNPSKTQFIFLLMGKSLMLRPMLWFFSLNVLRFSKQVISKAISYLKCNQEHQKNLLFLFHFNVIFNNSSQK